MQTENPVNLSKLEPCPIVLLLLRLGYRSFARFGQRLSWRQPKHQLARSLESLVRAVEYLEETRPFGAERTPRIAATEESIAILRACYHSAFLSCSTESQRRAAKTFCG